MASSESCRPLRASEHRARIPARAPADRSIALASHRIQPPVANRMLDDRRNGTTMTGSSANAPQAVRSTKPTQRPLLLPQGSRSRIPSTTRSRPEPEMTVGSSQPASEPRPPPPMPTVERSRAPPKQPTLRRKPSTIDVHTRMTRGVPAPAPAAGPPLPRPTLDTTVGAANQREPPPRPSILIKSSNPPRSELSGPPPRLAPPYEIAPSVFHLDRNQSIEAPLDPRLPTPPFTTHSDSPSTRYSESPGPWSRTSTPTSMSSHSPGLIMPAKWAPRPRPSSPNRRRLPIAWKGAQLGGADHQELIPTDSAGLPSLRESLTSSSSGSTIKMGEHHLQLPSASHPHREAPSNRERSNSIGKMDPPAPIPPPRKSSARAAPGVATRTPSPLKTSPLEPLPLMPDVSVRPSTSPSSSHLAPSRTPHAIETSTIVRDGPPPRPSRDGAPNLGRLDDASSIPVIQSNLAGLPFPGHRRRGSTDTTGSFPRRPSATASPDPGLHPSDAHHVGGSISRSASSDRAPTHLIRARSRGPSPGPVEGKLRKRGKSPSETSPNKGASRFGFFGRRANTASESDHVPDSSSSSKSLVKKGPAAGTGHEGYGRYAWRGRSGSVTSNGSGNGNGSAARSPSASSSRSGAGSAKSRKGSNVSMAERFSPIDDFVMDRLEPVIIVGGGGSGITSANGSVRSQTSRGDGVGGDGSQSSLGGRPSMDSQSSASTEFSTFSQSGSDIAKSAPPTSHGRPRAWTGHAKPVTVDHHIQHADDANKHPTASEWLLSRPAVAVSLPQVRRSKTLPSILTNTDSHLPQENAPAAIESDSDMSLVRQITSGAGKFAEGREGHWLKSKTSRQRPPPPLPPLTRPKVPQQLLPEELVESPEEDEVPELRVQVAARQYPSTRPLAHYAMLDGADDDEELSDLGDLMKEVEQFSDSENDEPERSPVVTDVTRSNPQTASVLLPDPPMLPPGFHNPRPVSPKVMLRSSDDLPPAPEPRTMIRETQLPRPSRLPQVGRIPRVVSSRFRKPPLQSFSRPFSTIRPDMVTGPGRAPATAIQAATIQEGVAQETATNQLLPSLASTTREPSVGQTSNRSSNSATGYRNPVTGREFLTFPSRHNSEVSCSGSSGIASLGPLPVIGLSAEGVHSEDEVWKEYDDLLDEVFSPGSGYSLRSSYGFPPPPKEPATASIIDNSSPIRPTHTNLPSITTSSAENNVALPWSAPAAVAPAPMQSRISQQTDNTGSPVSFSDFFAGYGERNLTPRKVSTAGNSPIRSGPVSPRTTVPPSVDPVPKEQAEVMSPQSDTGRNGLDDLDSHTNLRFGALMTSRWLSFGRVLFSPAHEGFKQAGGTRCQERLLVLDGLGNDDWSFYCALTYPNATVYNLSPSTSSARVSARKRESGAIQSPPNHRQIHQATLANPFPFPKGFFAAVVLRFPVASSEAAYRNAISECKRVLRPGGYLEISVLDLDLMNMGNRARRAVRDLKVRMQAADSTVSLKPASDLVLRLLGRRGFENVNRCTLGVPVAGNLVSSSATSVDEPSAHLSELLKDQSEKGDQGITKMVARVGRWWYSHCYELGTLPNGEFLSRSSIWTDRALLRECAARQTSFKQLICYAQKPLAPRRRTVSV